MFNVLAGGGRGVGEGWIWTDDLFLVVWSVAVDVDEVDSLRVELGEERLERCWSCCEWCRDGAGGVLDGCGGFGEGSRGALADCHDYGLLSPNFS